MKIRVIIAGITALLLSLGLQAQDGKYGKDSSECVKNLSVFHSYAKQNNYKDAYKSWRYCYANCPKVSKWVVIDGTKIMRYFIKANKSNEETFVAYVDSLMMVYDKWIELYDDSAKVTTYKGMYLYAYRNDDIPSLRKVKDYMETGFELLGAEVLSSAPIYYMTTLQRLNKYDSLEVDYMIDKYFEMSALADENFVAGSNDSTDWAKTQESIDELMEPYLQCDQLLPVYDKKLLEKPGKEQLEKMVRLMEKKGCDDSPTYEQAASMLCDIEPSSTCKFALAKMLYRKESYLKAQAFVLESIELEKDPVTKGDMLVLLADIYVRQGNRSAALQAANDALTQNPNNGEAYMIKAGVYLDMINSCSGFEKKAAFWVVVDLYERAAAVDGDVASRASAQASKYRKYFPAKDEIFFENLNEGDSYKVACLGGVSTKIRGKSSQ